MKRLLRIIGQTICILLVGAGLLATLAATFCLLAMSIVWFKEGALLPADWPIVAAGVKWLLGSGALLGISWWLHGKIVPQAPGADSVRLVQAKSGPLERLVANVFALGSFVVLAAWLWPRIPGNFIIKVPSIAGWLVVGFLGCHACIALHELGHLAAAWLVGFDLRKMQVGAGPVLWSRSCANGLLFQWRAWPQIGFMFATPRKTEGFRARQSLFVAGGPIANLITFAATYQLITHVFGGVVAAFAQGAGGLMLGALFWWLALSTVGGLIPHKMAFGHHEIWNDGYWLLRLWGGSRGDITELARRSNWREHLELLQADGSRDVVSTGHSSAGALQEQRALLSSRLLRKASLTSSPPG